MKNIFPTIIALFLVFLNIENGICQPTLIAPAEGLTVPGGLVVYEWTDISAFSYEFQQSKSPAFIPEATIYVFDTQVTLTAVNGTSYWRVRENAFGGPIQPWSNTFSITSSNVPQLTGITPSDGYEGQTLLPAISGVNTHFRQATRTMQFTLNQGSYTINYSRRRDFSIDDDSYQAAFITIPFIAPLGLYDVNFYNALDDSMKLLNGFYVRGSNIYSGRVYLDMNSNSVFDIGDLPYSNGFLNAPPYYTGCMGTGEFSDYIPTGNYTLSVANLPSYFTSIPANRTINFSGSGATLSGQDFAIQPIPGVHDMQVSCALSRNTTRPGLPINITLTYSNKGPAMENGQVYFVLPTGFIIDSVSVPGYSLSGDSLIWSFSGLSLMQSSNIIISLTAPTSLISGSYVEYVAGVTASGTDIMPSDNIKITNHLVSNSFDPNFKTASPTDLATVLSSTNRYIDFTIHFQNTGNDLAYEIRILDTIDVNLDISTIEVVSSSHNYRTIFYPNRVIEFRFTNINLVDSGTNEALSHGHIMYRIQALSSTTITDQIENTAFIYFDLNDPVATNTCYVSLGLGVNAYLNINDGLKVSPNPFTGSVLVSLDERTNTTSCILIRNVLGQEVFRKMTENFRLDDDEEINLDFLSKGIYFLEVHINDIKKVAKIIKK